MSEYIRNNPVMRSIEERRKQDEEVALRAEDLKLGITGKGGFGDPGRRTDHRRYIPDFR